MPKLYFKYGVMGSSKSAQALMCKYNYEQKGFKVLLLKPSVDTRDDVNGEFIVKSRIGLFSKCLTFNDDTNLYNFIMEKHEIENYGAVIIDEAQFCTKKHINQCKEITRFIPVLCYGLKTNFKSELFEGSKRLLEIADSISEIKSVCKCGRKATINARLVNGKPITSGAEIVLGGDSTYESMCYECWKNLQ
jgi:thymidine kinase